MSTVRELDWRPLTTGDAEEMHALVRDSERAERAPYVTTREEIDQLMADPDLELATDTRGGFLPDGRLACFGAVVMREHVVKRRAANLAGLVHPELRRRGLGNAVLSWSEERARQRLAEHDDGLPHCTEVWADEGKVDREALLTDFGYEPIRYYDEMRRPLSEPIPNAVLDSGLRLVPWSAGIDEQVRQAHNEAFADHWGSQVQTPQTWANRFSGSPYFRPDLTYVVLDGDEVAGYCLSYHSPQDVEVSGWNDGWLGQVGVRRAWRKRGVATAVMCHVMRRMLEADLDRAALHVDSANPTGATGLYRRLGFKADRREIRWAKQVSP